MPDREQILSIINEYALVTSPGPSGIAIGHIQYLTKLKGFYDTLMKVYYSLLEKPEPLQIRYALYSETEEVRRFRSAV